MQELIEKIILYMEQLHIVSITCRILLAAVCGCFIGLNRGKARQPAGMRTHMLVCIGATLVMLTGQYSYEMFGVGDPARLGAQVISGIGFLGAGSIIVSGKDKDKVKGLTTAAGLWTSACIGLCIGIGFYMATIVATLAVVIVLEKLKHWEHQLVFENVWIQIYVEGDSAGAILQTVQKLEKLDLEIHDISVLKRKKSGMQKAVVCVQNTGNNSKEEVVRKLERLEEIQYVKYTMLPNML